MKIFTAPQHTRFILPLFHPTKFFRLTCRAVLFFYGTGTANLSPNHDKEATRSVIYRDNLFLNARFQEAIQAAHDQDWQTFEKYSFYDAKMMEDLLYKCEHLMPLEIKCRYALQHYYSHGDHSPIIRKYVRRAKIIRPDNWRDALPESVRDIEMFTVYRGASAALSAHRFLFHGRSLTMLLNGLHTAVNFFTAAPAMYTKEQFTPTR